MGAIKINAIVISNVDYDDYAKIITVFSKEYGKLSFFAPGVNKSTSKNKYSIQTLSLSEFEIFKSKSEDKISKLKTGILKKEYFQISKNYRNYIYVSIMIKILEQIEQISNKKYKIFKMFCYVLENIEKNIFSFQSYLFFITYLIQESIQPLRLTKCVRCKKSNSRIVRYEHVEKGLICKKCLWPGEKIHLESFVKLLQDIGKKNIYSLLDQKYNSLDLVVLHNIIIDYYERELGFYLGPIFFLRNEVTLNVPINKIDLYK
ncbi:DNA repair protein RecO [Spiroplasma taiwanense]|uniref:DNA repair protein RecO n=1 Tax=Spiroplasma taiwanense CT-1 TaxID=1276220 RepID=S5LXT9_9MOLU|nr:DNA repair protein RecO [Spiroplasma taiwanense]AGR41411.1 DNA repair protein recO [Spiroplasma taiwanense CT-1]